MPINREHLPDYLSKMPKALNNEVHALLSEAKKLENSEIVLGRSLKGYDSTFTLPQESIGTVNKSSMVVAKYFLK